VIDYALILTRRFSGSEWTLNGDGYEGLTWNSLAPQPSKDELDGMWDDVVAEMQAERDAVVAARESARNKLRALGLNDSEINALGGSL
jgi:hypothetical protein